MAWIAAVGFGVAAAFGVSVMATGLAAMVIGGIVIGAVVGGLYSAITGGNILEGVLYGAIGGAVVGAGGFALGYAGAEAGSSVGSMSGSLGVEETTVGGTGLLSGGSGAGGGAGLNAGAETAGASLFTAKSIESAGIIASMGSAFLKGGNELDADAQQAEKEKDRQLQRDLADKQLAASKSSSNTGLQQTLASIASNEKISEAERKLSSEQFTANLDFNKKQYEEEKDLTASGKARFEAGIKDASEYVKGNTKSVSLVETKENRQSLPRPAWQGEVAASTQTQNNQQQVVA